LPFRLKPIDKIIAVLKTVFFVELIRLAFYFLVFFVQILPYHFTASILKCLIAFRGRRMSTPFILGVAGEFPFILHVRRTSTPLSAPGI
jgi:hypothetical protein